MSLEARYREILAVARGYQDLPPEVEFDLLRQLKRQDFSLWVLLRRCLRDIRLEKTRDPGAA